MTKEHKQFNLLDQASEQSVQATSEHRQDGLPQAVANNVKPFEVTAPNINRTDKDLNIKNLHIVTDTETTINHGQKFKTRSISTLVTGSVHTLSANDYLLGITSLSYAPNIGLPLPSLVGVGKTFIIKDEVGGAATTTITVSSAGEKTIDGSSTSTITTNYGSKQFYSNGSDWFTI